jgi:hypothetical protein
MIAMKTLRRAGVALALACASAAALAQHAIESVTANQQGSNVIVRIALDGTPDRLPDRLATRTRRASRSTSARQRTARASQRTRWKWATCAASTWYRRASARASCST